MPKATTPTGSARQSRRHNALEHDILSTGPLRAKAPKRKSKGKDEDEEENFIDSKASKKILQHGRELVEENDLAPSRPPTESDPFAFNSRADFDDLQDQDDAFPNEEAWGEDDEEVEEIEIEPEDLDMYNKFLPTENEDPLLKHGWPGQSTGGGQEEAGRNLADLILEKIATHEAGQDSGRQIGPVDEMGDIELPPKVVEVYEKVGLILSRWKSGKLPKPFKILPTVPNWEQIIEITKPDEWTPNAVLAATKIWVSHKPVVVQRFLEMVLLERVREDIYENKKLNVHLMAAIKKALYKPASFFKGFLFPLVASGTLTIKEAQIVSKPLREVSIPVLHSAAALKGLCDIAAQEASQGNEGGGATNVFILTLLSKKYALPYQVLDALVFHFLRFRSVDPASVKEGDSMVDLTSERAATKAKLPVIWHQCLLAFAQRYRNDITEDQREMLLDLLITHGHQKIGPEIRRELLAGRGRGIPIEQPQDAVFDGDDTMLIDG